MLNLCASRILAGHGRRMKQLGLTNDIMARCEDLFSEALAGRKPLTRDELLKLVTNEGISTKGQRGYHILWHIAHRGVICMGPTVGKQQTFVLLDEWVPQVHDLSREQALAELVWRYFSSHGPATEADFARWSGLTLTDTRAGLEMLQDRFTQIEYDVNTYWKACDTDIVPSQLSAHLLPAFDETVIGYQDRSVMIADEHAQKVVPGNNGVFHPVIVLDGQVIGTWKRQLKGKSVDISLYPFALLGDAESLVMRAAESYSHFVGLPIGSISIH